jgi:hypothetical protein
MQLAAYRKGLGLSARCGILFVSMDKQAKLVWAEEKEIERGLKMFSALLMFFYEKTELHK